MNRILHYTNEKNYKLKIELNLTEGEQPRFSASGYLYKGAYFISGGQCLDIIPEFTEFMENEEAKQQLLTIYQLWNKYHLNDMHPDCEHQRHNWIKKDIKLYTYHYKGNWFNWREKYNLIKNNSILSNAIKLNNSLQQILKFSYHFTSEKPLNSFPAIIQRHYELEKTEIKNTGWISYDAVFTPSGILSKPCEICGYKYGTAWIYEAIPEADLKQIKKLIQTN